MAPNAAHDLRVAVVGASLGGLGAANVLHRLGARVEVFEAFPSGFHLRGGALGSVDIDLVQTIRGVTSNNMPNIRGHGHFYGDLWQFFYDGLPEGTVTFGADATEITEAGSDNPRLVVNGAPREFDLIVGADGGKSTIRPYVTDKVPTYAGYTVWRGLVATDGPEGAVAGPPSGSASVGGFQYATLGFPVSGPGGKGVLWNCGVYMAMPEAEVEAPSRNRQVKPGMREVPAWFVPFVRKLFGDRNAKFWDECAKKGKVSPHAVWELACDRVVRGRVLLLGDAAHMASPRTGAGAYTAMVDAVVLGQAMTEHKASLAAALQAYNGDTVQRGEQLFRRSRQAAAQFAPDGLEAVHPPTLLDRLEL